MTSESNNSGSNKGTVIALAIGAVTVLLVVIGTVWPSQSALANGGSYVPFLASFSSSPEGAVNGLLGKIGRHDFASAYDDLANKSQFTEPDFERDLNGTYASLRTYAALTGFDVYPQHSSADDAKIRVNLHWSSVVGGFSDVRDLDVTKSGDQWRVAWPVVLEAKVPPQVIPVNYLRWDVIYRGAGDDWGSQDVEAPHVRIIDMHPIDRGGSVVVLGEILNEDTVPAFVTVKSSLLAKNGSVIATEDAFDKISHLLLPKQVTPFRIDFRGVAMSQVDSIRMDPSSSLIAASADPVIEIENQKLSPLPNSSLSGELLNQSGQVANIAHVLGTFYDKSGHLVWVSDEYTNRALLPQIPLPFTVALPPDLAGQVATYRVVTSTYISSPQ